MTQTHIISALIEKHSELQGEIRYYQDLLQELRTNLDTITKSIRVFDPSFDTRQIKIKLHRKNYFGHGKLMKNVIQTVKDSGKVTPQQVVDKIKEQHDAIDINYIKTTVYGVMYKLVDRGIFKLEAIDGVKLYSINND
jgi:hypothetical protein